jgi:amino acid transporter
MRVGESHTGSVGFLKRLLVGRAIPSFKSEHQLLPKFLALPVFSSDPLSSVAYATEEMMLVLVLAGEAGLRERLPLAIGIGVLLVIVVTSYRQTVRAYPMGGGSYIVARENLGTIPGLIAAAAILMDYVLTVAVSVTAGTVAITSAIPSLAHHRVAIATGLVAFVAIANLRGVREAGVLFAIPTYGFVAVVGLAIVVGFVRCLGGCPLAPTADLPLEAEAGLGVFLVARAFSSGATALTGVEAIADGVQAFRRPQAKNAANTLAIMAVLAVSMFLGITFLTQLLQVRINHDIAATNSVLSQIGRTVFGDGSVLFFILQVFTAAILILAANTAFQDFPRLSSILARDRFMPSQFRNRGDRLVFSNGVVILAGLAAVLIWIYDADLTRLIQLYVVGVFTAFTLSQAGMVRRWFRHTGEHWKRKAVINGVGATTTGVVLIVVTITKYAGGAKIVVWGIPVLVVLFLLVNRHYERVGRALRLGRVSARDVGSNEMILLVPDLRAATAEAVSYLRAVRPERMLAMYTGPPASYPIVAERWRTWAPRMGDLGLLAGADHHLVGAVRRLVRERRPAPNGFLTIVIPEVVAGGLWRQLLLERPAILLKTAMLFEPGVVVTDVPVPAARVFSAGDPAPRPIEPARHIVLVPVPGVHDATVRAVSYARALEPSNAEALYMAMDADPAEQETLVLEWRQRELQVPLTIVEAAFRDIGEPLLREIRSYTGRMDTIVTVIIPELIPRHWIENLLHNQTSLFIKRLLLFEPRVVTTSVPFHLADPEVAPSLRVVAP